MKKFNLNAIRVVPTLEEYKQQVIAVRDCIIEKAKTGETDKKGVPVWVDMIEFEAKLRTAIDGMENAWRQLNSTAQDQARKQYPKETRAEKQFCHKGVNYKIQVRREWNYLGHDIPGTYTDADGKEHPCMKLHHVTDEIKNLQEMLRLKKKEAALIQEQILSVHGNEMKPTIRQTLVYC